MLKNINTDSLSISSNMIFKLTDEVFVMHLFKPATKYLYYVKALIATKWPHSRFQLFFYVMFTETRTPRSWCSYLTYFLNFFEHFLCLGSYKTLQGLKISFLTNFLDHFKAFLLHTLTCCYLVLSYDFKTSVG